MSSPLGLLIIEKIMLGFMLAVPLGPVSVEMIKRGLKGGFYAAFSVRLGGVIGNILCLIATFLGLSPVLTQPMVMALLGGIGSLSLLYMGIRTLIQNIDMPDISSSVSQHRNGLIQGFYLSLLNPFCLLFWSGIFVANMKENEGFYLNLFMIAGVLIWGTLLSVISAFGRHLLDKSLLDLLTKGAGLFMVFYSFKYAYGVFTQF